ITYGCGADMLGEQIPALAKEANLAVILGVYNPRDAAEVAAAERLLRRDDLRSTIVACCVGNEAITFRRATLDDVRAVVGRLRAARRVPTTTTEIVQAYGNKDLFDPKICDFSFVNCHALFADVRDPEKAGRWAAGQLKD